MPLPTVSRDVQVEDEKRDEVEERRQHDRLLRLQHAGRHDGGDRIRRVVEAVHEVERQRDRDQSTTTNHMMASCTRSCDQAFSSTMPSMMLATSSQRSVIDFEQLVDRLQLDQRLARRSSSRNSLDIAERITWSASDSSRSISSQTFRIALALLHVRQQADRVLHALAGQPADLGQLARLRRDRLHVVERDSGRRRPPSGRGCRPSW